MFCLPLIRIRTVGVTCEEGMSNLTKEHLGERPLDFTCCDHETSIIGQSIAKQMHKGFAVLTNLSAKFSSPHADSR